MLQAYEISLSCDVAKCLTKYLIASLYQNTSFSLNGDCVQQISYLWAVSVQI